VDEREIFESIARQRIRCPLLNESDRCDLYTYRPITCRLYGLPVEIGGESTTCGFSGFEEGKSYPTVKVDSLHGKLYEISDNLVLDIQSGYTRMGELLVPVSMALLTNYDEEYLGVGVPAEAGEQGE
jgi:Fe-S-cluster containining protein